MFSCTAGVANNPLLTRQENLVEDSSTRKQSSNVVRAAACKYPGCTRSLSSDVELRNHMVHDHACTECGTGKTTLASLNEHAVKNGHSPYNCSYEGCLLRFSRSDSVERHRATHLKVQKRYPCTHCGKFQGDKAFKQLDHLTQHLRGYHRIGEDDAQVKAASCPSTSTLDQHSKGGTCFPIDSRLPDTHAQGPRRDSISVLGGRLRTSSWQWILPLERPREAPNQRAWRTSRGRRSFGLVHSA